MNYVVRPLTADDEPIVWEMLQYAAHEPSVASVQQQPELARYAVDWGRVGDVGYVATLGEMAIGAAWLRIWLTGDRGFGYISPEIPELAIAVLPEYRGQGIGTQLLIGVLTIAKDQFPAVSLSVRADNAAVRWYERVGFSQVAGSAIVNRTGDVSFNMVREFE